MGTQEAAGLGARVREHRLRRGWSQEALAEAAGMSVRALRDLERGASRPRARTVAALLDALGVDGDDSERPGLAAPDLSPAVPPTADQVGEEIRRLRTAAGLTQRQLARRALLSERAISDLERGLHRPRASTLATLADALGLDDAARQHLLDQALGLQPMADRDEPPSALRPADTGPCHGRTAEIETTLDALGAARVVSLVGVGGVGKTRLAAEVVDQLRLRVRGRVVEVPLADVHTRAGVVTLVAEQLGLVDAADADLDDLVAHALLGVDVLVLDNLEQLVTTVGPLVTDWTAKAETLRVLCTSRVPLRLAGERVVTIEPLAADDEASPALHLLRDRLRAADPVATEATPSEVLVALCRVLDGLPLALELAASWARLLTPAEILARLASTDDVLRSGDQRLPERHRSLDDVIATSCALLDGSAVELFEDLSVLAPTFDLALAERVAPHVDFLGGLATLVEAGLLARRTGPDGNRRFRWLTVVQEHARRRLDASGRATVAKERLHLAVQELVADAAPRLVGDDQAHWLDRFEEWHPQIRRLLDDDPPPEVEGAVAAACWRFWHLRGHFSEGVERLERATANVSVADPSWATLAYGLGVLTYLRGRVAEAEDLWQRALDAYQRLGDDRSESAVLSGLGMIHQYRGELDTADELYARAAEVGRRSGDRRVEAVAIANQASTAEMRGGATEAIRLYGAARAALTEVGDHRSVADMTGNLARAHAALGDRARARALATEALARFTEQDDRYSIGETTQLLGRLAADDGTLEVAIEWLHEARAVAEELGDRWGDAANTLLAARLQLAQGDHETALRSAQRAARIHEELHNPTGADEAAVVAAQARCALGQPAIALSELAGALGLATMSPSEGDERTADWGTRARAALLIAAVAGPDDELAVAATDFVDRHRTRLPADRPTPTDAPTIAPTDAPTIPPAVRRFAEIVLGDS